MLKAIVTVMDENDRIVQANRLIYETNGFGTPVAFGMEHDFHFKVVTADEEMTNKINLTADEIRKMMEVPNEQG